MRSTRPDRPGHLQHAGPAAGARRGRREDLGARAAGPSDADLAAEQVRVRQEERSVRAADLEQVAELRRVEREDGLRGLAAREAEEGRDVTRRLDVERLAR